MKLVNFGRNPIDIEGLSGIHAIYINNLMRTGLVFGGFVFSLCIFSFWDTNRAD